MTNRQASSTIVPSTRPAPRGRGIPLWLIALPLPPQIRRAFRNLASKEHPDKGGNPDRFRAIQQAYEVLSHPARRQEYDATGTVVRTVEEEFVDSFGGGAPIMPIMSAQKYSAWMLAGT